MKRLIGEWVNLCSVCGSKEFSPSFVNEVLEIDGKHILVENIPAQSCSRCGERIFTKETTERVRRMVHGRTQPVKSVSMDVYAY